jgi:glucose-1-phosphate thymidylyltransferase
MKVFILAGGFATRLWPLTETRAKPLLLLNGKTILAHILQKIPSEADIYLLTNKKFEKDFLNECQILKRKKVTIFCEDSHSDGEKLGALKALSVAIQMYGIQKNIFVFAGDNVLPKFNIEHIYCSTNEACIAVREVSSLAEAQKFGVIELENNPKFKNTSISKWKVRNFEEKPHQPKSRLVSTGFACIGHELFPILHDFAKEFPDSLGAIFQEFVKRKKTLLASEVLGEWFDVGSFETYLEAHKKLQTQNLHSQNLHHSHNIFSGKVFVGKESVVENCQILDSIIYPGCTLRNCHIAQSVIDENCDLEGLDLSRKLIRKNTILKDRL